MSDALRLLGLSLLFGGHLLCMNVAAAAPLLAAWCDLRAAGRQDLTAGMAGRHLLAASVLGLLLGVLLGLAYGLALYSSDHFSFTDAYGRLADRIQWAIYELVFSVGLFGAMWLWWRLADTRTSFRWRVLRALLVVAAALNLLYHFPPLFAVFAKVATSADSQGAVFSRAELRAELFQPDVVSRWLHFILAAVSAAGLALCVATWRSGRGAANAEESDRLCLAGGRIALAATLAQIPAGMYVVITLPAAAQSRMLGAELGSDLGGTVGPLLFLFSVLAALGLMHQLAAISFGQTRPARVVAACLLYAAIVVAMCGALLSVRDALGG